MESYQWPQIVQIFNTKQELNASRRGLYQNKIKSKRYVGFKYSNNIPTAVDASFLRYAMFMSKTLYTLLVEISVNLCNQKKCLDWSVHDLESFGWFIWWYKIMKKPFHWTDVKLFVLLWFISRTSIMEL